MHLLTSCSRALLVLCMTRSITWGPWGVWGVPQTLEGHQLMPLYTDSFHML